MFIAPTILILLLAASSRCHSLAEKEVISAATLYGVRWFLGEEFRLQEPVTYTNINTTKCHLMLIFNTL
jgi:hypothetical protein